MTLLVALDEVEIVLLGNLSFFAQQRPKLGQNALSTFRLVTRWGDDKNCVLELVRGYGVLPQRVGLDDVYSVRNGNIDEGLSLAQNSSKNGYRIAFYRFYRLCLNAKQRGCKECQQ